MCDTATAKCSGPIRSATMIVETSVVTMGEPPAHRMPIRITRQHCPEQREAPPHARNPQSWERARGAVFQPTNHLPVRRSIT